MTMEAVVANTNSSMDITKPAGKFYSEDALQAVKLDPAVLEAHITVNTTKTNTTSPKPDNLTFAQETLAQETPAQETPAEETLTKKSLAQEKIAQESSPREIKSKGVPGSMKFEEMLKMQKAALLSLAPQQFELLLKYAGILRLQRQHHQKHLNCAFCKNNGEPSSWYASHLLKDNRGRVRCPVLRAYRCPGCGATGDHAHTIKYCPDN